MEVKLRKEFRNFSPGARLTFANAFGVGQLANALAFRVFVQSYPKLQNKKRRGHVGPLPFLVDEGSPYGRASMLI